MADPTTPITNEQTVTFTIKGDPEHLAAAQRVLGNSVKDMGVQVAQATQNLSYFDEKTTQTTGVLNIMSGMAGKVTDVMKNFSLNVTNALDSMNSKADLTTGQMMKLSAAFTFMGAAGDPFKSFRSDTLNTMSDQLAGLIHILPDSNTIVGKFAEKIGIHIPDAVKAAGGSLKQFIMAMATNASSATEMEDIYVKGAAATGQLGDVHQKAGAQLEHMNSIVAAQRELMEKSGDATNSTSEQMASYYNQLRLIPGALKEMSDSEKAAIGGTDVLTATIRLARGTGMEYADIMNDVHTAIRNYGASFPEAMRFTNQISEISQKYGVELKDMQSQLISTSEAMKMFGNESEGAANIMNELVGAFRAQGLSGAVSSQIVGDMTRQIGQLSLAQKAFISGQQGGPGGLQGAFNIDNILRQKDGLQKVFEMTKNQMTKMMGPLVSVQEASQSPQAAAQLTRQISMLKQGPLGQFAKTDQEAERIIEAFKTGKPGDIKALAKDMAAPLDKGLDYQKQTATGISQMLRLMQHAAGTAAGGALDLFQAGTTAGAGTEFDEQNTEAVGDMRDQRTRFMTEAGTANTEDPGIKTINKMVDFGKSIPNAAKAAFQGITGAMGAEGAPQTGGIEDPAVMRRRMEENAQARQAAKELDNINNIRDLPGFGGPGHGLGNAAASVVGKQTGNLTAPHAGMTIPPSAAAAGNMGQITVHVEGYCLDCGEKIRSRSQSYAVAPQTK